AGIETEILLVDYRVADLAAAVEHGVTVELTFKKRLLEVRIQGQAVTKIVALEHLQAGPQRFPGQRLRPRHPVRPQPAHRHMAACGKLLPGSAEFAPQRVDVRAAGMYHGGAAPHVAE